MSTSRTEPSAAQIIYAIAASLDAGQSVDETFRLIARAGPASAQRARRLSEALRSEPIAAVLATAGLITADEKTVIAFGEETGRLPAALRWAAERARIRSTRFATLCGAVIGPLLFAVAGLVLEPLPQLFMGGSISWWVAFRPAIVLCAATVLVLWGLPRLATLPLLSARAFANNVPFLGAILTNAGEAKIAALIAAFANADELALAPRAARTIVATPWGEALATVAADPLAPVPTFSESFALALQVGLAARDLPTRFAAVHAELETKLTARLRTILRVVAFSILGVITIQSVRGLVSTPIPGLGLDLGGAGATPEMKELQRELDNLEH